MAHTTTLPVLSASTLNGTSVHNTAGEDLGHVEDIMIDFSEGRVAYVVLSFGGFLGIGDKLFAVPLEALNLDTNHENVIFDISKERLENAPGFDKNNWPTTPNYDWYNTIYSYYDIDPYWAS